ncbi:helix-turn-helix transcriptional regulator [Adlercreutzia equolifaciens]|uniref:helix-turn-helix domain-containing protein n=1 Tax=Adlercreutzia equolifaciens TaxID=446660 RepID=UPI0023AFEA84|nr:helix-turn-helix transcriptional regulator [Adlercreutzia equolifaciens]MDE8701471.1 helix-turn-helix transcriptional regulator [Adlercreutzia equolifaciens]
MNVEIAQRLAELRRERGFSQEDLATQLGLSRQAVSKWERAESAPDMGNLIALADLYEVTIDELLRVSPEVEEDMRYEAQERATSAENEVVEAAAAAQEAAVRAQSAAAEAATVATAASKESVEPAKVVVEVNASRPIAPSMPGASAQQPPFVQGAPYGAPRPVPPMSSTPMTPPPTPMAPSPAPMPVPASAPKDPLQSFPYPLLCAVIFLLVGFCFGWWHPGWVIFLTIPFYYWAVNVLEADPGFQEWKAERAQRAASFGGAASAEGVGAVSAPTVQAGSSSAAASAAAPAGSTPSAVSAYGSQSAPPASSDASEEEGGDR